MAKRNKLDNLNIEAPNKRKGKEMKLTTSKVSTDEVMINLRVTKEFRKELKQIALDNDTTMTEIIKKGIELFKEYN